MDYKNTKKQGDAGLGAAIAFFAKRGDCINIPLTDSQEYDLIVDCGGTLRKIHVKTTNSLSPHGIYQVELRTTGGNKSRQIRALLDKTKIDFLFVLAGDGSEYLIPANMIESNGSLNLGKKYEAFKV